MGKSLAGSGCLWIRGGQSEPLEFEGPDRWRGVHRLAKPGAISMAQSDCMFPEWFGPGFTFAIDARSVDRYSFRAVRSLRARRDIEKARLERAFSLRLGRLANGQLPTGWK